MSPLVFYHLAGFRSALFQEGSNSPNEVVGVQAGGHPDCLFRVTIRKLLEGI
jgi:hypothetical protein